MTTKTYNRLRYVTQIVLPALATFMITIGSIWNIQISEQISTTIAAIVTLLSGILGASSAIYDKEGGKNNGTDMGDRSDFDTNNLHKYMHISNMESAEHSEEEEQLGESYDVTFTKRTQRVP